MTGEVIRIYAYAAREYLAKYPSECSPDSFATVAVKNREHGRQNPNALLYRAPSITVDQVGKKY